MEGSPWLLSHANMVQRSPCDIVNASPTCAGRLGHGRPIALRLARRWHARGVKRRVVVHAILWALQQEPHLSQSANHIRIRQLRALLWLSVRLVDEGEEGSLGTA